MPALYLLAFVAGWVACWNFAAWIARRMFHRPTLIERALGRLDYDQLVGIGNSVDAELQKRRAS